MKGRIVVTGGAGFIGSNLVAALNARGVDDVLIADRLGTGEKWRNLQGLRFEDFLDKEDFLARVRGRSLGAPRAILHMGACSATTERDADYLMRNNYGCTRALCEWAMETGARFVYASSAATYGAGEHGYDDDPAALESLRPLNMYGYSKHAFDLWAARRGLLGSIAGLKFFNVYGPGEAHKGDMRSVVHKAWHEILATGGMRLFRSHRPGWADGEQTRDFLHVDDAVGAVLHLMDADPAAPARSGLFNCGTGRERTWLDLARALFAAMGREPKIEFVDMPESIRDRYQYHTRAETARLRAAGYDREFLSLEEGIRRYVERMRSEGAAAGARG